MSMTSDDTPDPVLAEPLAALRRSMASVDAPRGVEKELMDAFAAQFPPRRWYHALSPRQWTLTGGAAAIATVALLAVMLPRVPMSPSIPAPGAEHVATDDGPAFIALQPIERIEQETNPRMLEADVPRTALASLGVPVDPEDAGDSVRAEMLVGADGSPLALRLITLP
jgi:hypothetical protein